MLVIIVHDGLCDFNVYDEISATAVCFVFLGYLTPTDLHEKVWLICY